MTLQQLQSEYEQYNAYAKEFAKINAEYNQKAVDLQKEYDNNLSNISISVKEFEKSIIAESEKSKKEAERSMEEQKKTVNKLLQKASSIDEKNNLAKMLESIQLAYDFTVKKIEEITRESEIDLANKPEQIRNAIVQNFEQKKHEIITSYEKYYNDYIGLQNKLFANRYETVSSNNPFFWSKMPETDGNPITYTIYAVSQLKCELFGNSYNSEIYHLAPFIDRNNIIITCDSISRRTAHSIANAIILRNVSAMPKNLKLNLVDTEGQTFNLGEVRRLDPKIYDKFLTEKKDVQDTLQYLKNHIVSINQKLSNAKPTLYDFNLSANLKQNNQLLYFSDFTNDLEDREIDSIGNILKNGPRAGINSILVINKDQVDIKNDREDRYKNSIDNFKNNAFVIDLTDSNIALEYGLEPENIIWETDDKLNVEKIIEKSENAVKTQTGKTIPFMNYLLPQNLWWKKSNDFGIETQVGVLVEENNKPFNLKISLDADNFSGMVVGTPGQGKSSLYHTFICNAITQYSPRELQFYLIDLKAVEFEMYARESIYTPHVAVVASNSEREFALNVIEELIEESKKRAEKYSKAGASGMWTYNSKVGENEKDPIKILIIDEFIQLFAVNDKIAQRAYDALMHIIQVSRAFGILILTACQSLKTGQYSLGSMISLVPLRFVFKSGDSDNMEMLKQSISSRDSILKKITFPGQLVFNDNFGDENNLKKNQFIQTLFINDNEREKLLIELSDYSKENLAEKYKRRVYDLSKLAKMEDNEDLFDLSAIRNSKEFEVFLGKAMSLASSDVYFSFKNETASNLLVVGGEDQNVSTRIILNSILGVMFNLKPEEVEFYIFNGLDEDDVHNEFINDCFINSEYHFEIIKSADVFYNVSTLYQEIIDLKSNDTKSDKYKILVFLQSDRINFGFDDGMIENFKDELKVIVEQGTLLGYHTMIQSSNYQNFDNNFNGEIKKYFKHKVALQMSSSSAYSFVGDDRPSNLSDTRKKYTVNFGYYCLDGNSNIQKFNAYDLPNSSWIHKKLSF